MGRQKTQDLIIARLNNARPYNEGGHYQTCFSVRVAADYKFMFAAWSIMRDVYQILIVFFVICASNCVLSACFMFLDETK